MNNKTPRAPAGIPPHSMVRVSPVILSSIGLMAIAMAGLVTSDLARAQSGLDDPPSTDAHFTIGIGAAHVPRYEGADQYKTRALPLINYRNGRFFAGALGGIGYDFSPVADLQFGPILSYRFGRNEDDADRLRGLGDIDGGVDVGAFVRWNLRPFFLHATVKHGVGGDVTGTQLKLGAGYGFAFGPADRMVLDASVDWADKEVMQAYFGVTGVQPSRSGLSRYDAESGVRRYGVGALWTHTFTSQWFSTVGVTAYRLGSPAADSPITLERNASAVSVGVGYRF
jgi:outer membrane protein